MRVSEAKIPIQGLPVGGAGSEPDKAPHDKQYSEGKNR